MSETSVRTTFNTTFNTTFKETPRPPPEQARALDAVVWRRRDLDHTA
jgi:hypothetical protein